MKVLHLISSGGMYGAEAVLLNLATAQQRSGCEPIAGVFANAHALHLEVAEEARKRGIRVELFPCKSRFDRKLVKAIRKFVKANEVEIVHGHGYKSDLYGYLAARPLGVPFVATCHSTPMGAGGSLSVRFYEYLDSLILRRANRVACVSDLIAQTLRKAGVRGERISTIYNGTDLSRFIGAAPTLRDELGIGTRPLIGMVGRLEEIKGMEYFIRAVGDILKEIPDAMFVIVGEGPLRAQLESLIHSLRLDTKVRLTGRREDMPGVYASLDLFVLASINEGMPMTVLEAMSARRPVIATCVGGVGKLVLNEETGLLVEPRDVSGLRDTMMRCLRNPQLASQLAKKGEELVRDTFSSDAMAQNYLEFYRQVLHARDGKTVSSLQEV